MSTKDLQKQREAQLKREEALFNYTGEDEVISSHRMLEEVENRQEADWFYSSKIPALDNHISGFYGGELTVVSGLTGNGKTLFCQTLTHTFAKQKANPMWFSFEVQPKQFLKQFGEPLPLFYSPKKLAGKSIKWIWQRIYEGKLKYGVDSVFIDHLHFLIDMKNPNQSVEIGGVMRALKKLALEFDLAFFLIAHTKKTKPDEELGLGSARDSSFIEQEADNVFYIWRRPSDPVESILKIAKNRRFGVMNKKVKLMKQGNFLVEVDRNGS